MTPPITRSRRRPTEFVHFASTVERADVHAHFRHCRHVQLHLLHPPVHDRHDRRSLNARSRWFFLTALVVAGLAVDAYVHLDLAGQYEPIATSTLSQADLFRAEAVVAILAAAALIVRPRRYTAAFAAAVAGSGLFALLLYRYVDVGQIGPIPAMYEPVWFTEKAIAAIAEAIAFLAALSLTVWPFSRSGAATDRSVR